MSTQPRQTPSGLGVEALERFAAHLADLIADRITVRLPRPELPYQSDWLNTEGAARYLRCSAGRIHNLTSARKIPFHREGGRLLFSRQELDEWIRSGQAAQ